jgi:small subunit ribosomal protein S11
MAKDKTVTRGKIYITATFNNTLVTVTDPEGATVAWGSSGAVGFKGARKSTPFAATTAMEQVLHKAQGVGFSQADVFIKGPGPGRDAALRAIRSVGIKINMIADVTPSPHNGPRPKKPRRI